METVPAERRRFSRGWPLLDRLLDMPSGWHFGRFEAAFLVLVALALGMRLWELGGRAMHYDEAIHLHYAWRLLNSEGAAGGFPWVFGTDFIHSPWMHGPFQIELVALALRIFGDTEFTARLVYALFGTLLVGLPYFFRDYLGRAGALAAGVMLTLSPVLLYFSRFGRNDILMACGSLALVILMWRYIHEGKHRYLYLSALVLAFMFGAKETAYMVTFILGVIAFLLALPTLPSLVLGRTRLSQISGPMGFLLLLITLTLPQWVPIVSLAQESLGLTLANTEGVVGAPDWADPFLGLPIYRAQWWFHTLAILALVGGLGWLASRGGRTGSGNSLRRLVISVGAPLAAVAAAALLAFRPISPAWSPAGAPILDFTLAGLVAGAAVAALVATNHPWRRGAVLLAAPAQLTLIYAFLLTDAISVGTVVNGVLPTGISVETPGNAIPLNYLVAGLLLLGALNLSIYLGVRWLGGRWLLAALIFYLAWATIYTTVFTNAAGLFSGVWQGMGYWIAQQDVARGSQPWYYYFVGLSVYEVLPVVFGAAGAVYFWKKRDPLGLVLTIWAALTLVAYTIASEKMPWLLVNITLPLILLAGKYLGRMIDRVNWRQALYQGRVLLLLFPALIVAGAVYLIYVYINPEGGFSPVHWGVLFCAALLAIATARLVRQAQPENGSALVILSLAALLLVFGAVGAFRASYSFDDENQELLVYSQGSKDLKDTFRDIDGSVLRQQPAEGAVKVDYDMWYPFAWYVRAAERAGVLNFECFKSNKEADWNATCKPAEAAPDSKAFLLSATHSGSNAGALSEFQQDGPLRNLLWFNEEAYRRPGEQRFQCHSDLPGLSCAPVGQEAEGHPWRLKGLPSKEQISKDFGYFKSVASSRESWFDAVNYFLFRNLSADWYNGEYYIYLAPEIYLAPDAP